MALGCVRMVAAVCLQLYSGMCGSWYLGLDSSLAKPPASRAGLPSVLQQGLDCEGRSPVTALDESCQYANCVRHVAERAAQVQDPGVQQCSTM